MDSDRFARARLLLEQGRHDLAITEITARLADAPNDADGHILLAICQNALKQPQAIDTAKRALELAPDNDRAHFVLSLVEANRGNYPDAEAAIRRAIALNSWYAVYYGQLAGIHAMQYRWSDALAAADEGLAIDPDDETCLNNRAAALTKLGRHADAARTLEGTLEKHPEDAFTHANRGWSLLHENRPEEARTHFREALRLEPNSEWAKDGLLESLRARSWFYRRVLQFTLWLSRFPPRVQFGLLIGLVVGVRILGNLSKQMPAAAPVFNVLILAYAAFAAATWFAKHVRNAALAFDPDGRLVLTREQKWLAGICVALVGVVLILAAVAIFGGNDAAGWAALWTFLLAVHVASVHEVPWGRFRWLAAVASMIVLGAYAFVLVEQDRVAVDRRVLYERAVALDDRTADAKRQVETLPGEERERFLVALGAEQLSFEREARAWKAHSELLDWWQSALNFLSLGTLLLHSVLTVKARQAAFE